MNIKNDITELLNRFINGQTTQEEETLLADYFHTHDVDEDLAPYKDMFVYFADGMKEDLLKADFSEHSVSPTPATEPRRKHFSAKLSLAWLPAGIAAMIALAFIVVSPDDVLFNPASQHADNGCEKSYATVRSVGKAERETASEYAPSSPQKEETQAANGLEADKKMDKNVSLTCLTNNPATAKDRITDGEASEKAHRSEEPLPTPLVAFDNYIRIPYLSETERCIAYEPLHDSWQFSTESINMYDIPDLITNKINDYAFAVIEQSEKEAEISYALLCNLSDLLLSDINKLISEQDMK